MPVVCLTLWAFAIIQLIISIMAALQKYFTALACVWLEEAARDCRRLKGGPAAGGRNPEGEVKPPKIQNSLAIFKL